MIDYVDKYGYSKYNPPKSCMDCEWHVLTYSPTYKCHTMHSDYCGTMKMNFAKMHIVLLGEFRSMSKHDEDDLRKHLPYECPYFNTEHVFWEMYGRIKMDRDTLIYECAVHYKDYEGWYVYSIPENIDYLVREIPEFIGLKYLYVEEDDYEWFLSNF